MVPASVFVQGAPQEAGSCKGGIGACLASLCTSKRMGCTSEPPILWSSSCCAVCVSAWSVVVSWSSTLLRSLYCSSKWTKRQESVGAQREPLQLALLHLANVQYLRCAISSHLSDLRREAKPGTGWLTHGRLPGCPTALRHRDPLTATTASFRSDMSASCSAVDGSRTQLRFLTTTNLQRWYDNEGKRGGSKIGYARWD